MQYVAKKHCQHSPKIVMLLTQGTLSVTCIYLLHTLHEPSLMKWGPFSVFSLCAKKLIEFDHRLPPACLLLASAPLPCHLSLSVGSAILGPRRGVGLTWAQACPIGCLFCVWIILSGGAPLPSCTTRMKAASLSGTLDITAHEHANPVEPFTTHTYPKALL